MPDVRFAIVGAGNIGKLHAQAIAAIPGASVAVVCDRAGAGAPRPGGAVRGRLEHGPVRRLGVA